MINYREQYKEPIENLLNSMELQEAGELILQYEQIAPMDMDLITYKSLYFLYNGELEDALQFALLGVRRYPMNGDMYYNLAYVYELKNEPFLACENYYKAQYIYEYTQDKKSEELKIDIKISTLLDQIDLCAEKAKKEHNTSYINKVKFFSERSKTCFGMHITAFRSMEQVIGRYHWINNSEKKYIGLYRVDFTDWVENRELDLIHCKGEFLSVTEDTSYQVTGACKEYLLPISTEEKNTFHHFLQDGQKYAVLQKQNKQFNYYRVKQNTVVASSGTSYYGKPIPLEHKPTRERLVLNIFVDGLSQEILNDDQFQSLMPYTYRFFQSGIICRQAYSAAEWTYPSLANYVTGLDTPGHMMFHNMLDGSLPEEVPTLAEYFHEAGYYTAQIISDWRCIPPYGHCRGYDRYLYQHPSLDAKGERIIADTLEHLDAFQDTDQFVWIGIGDLHDIADGFELPIGVQSRQELGERIFENIGPTSVKQSASTNKINAYKKTATHIDLLLNSLYTYIQDRYSENEVLVSLFADHGQGYLIPEGRPFMSKERTKVAFMFRGCSENKISDEIISTSDYISILCKLANIQMKKVPTQTNLPVTFGGNQEREYALSESLHPKDPYRAAFYAKDYTVYFKNNSPVGEDGRFELNDYSMVIEDKLGNTIQDEHLYKKYMDLILEHIAPLIIY